MKERRCHYLYSNTEENLAIAKRDEVEVLIRGGAFYNWSLYLHCDYPFVPKEMRDKSVLVDRTSFIFS